MLVTLYWQMMVIFLHIWVQKLCYLKISHLVDSLKKIEITLHLKLTNIQLGCGSTEMLNNIISCLTTLQKPIEYISTKKKKQDAKKRF